MRFRRGDINDQQEFRPISGALNMQGLKMPD